MAVLSRLEICGKESGYLFFRTFVERWSRYFGNHPEWKPTDIEAKLRSEQCQYWLLRDGKGVICLHFITETINTKEDKIFVIQWMMGRNLMALVKNHWLELQAILKFTGFSEIHITAERPSLQKYLISRWGFERGLDETTLIRSVQDGRNTKTNYH